MNSPSRPLARSRVGSFAFIVVKITSLIVALFGLSILVSMWVEQMIDRNGENGAFGISMVAIIAGWIFALCVWRQRQRRHDDHNYHRDTTKLQDTSALSCECLETMTKSKQSSPASEPRVMWRPPSTQRTGSRSSVP